MELHAIGVVESPLTDPALAPKQGHEGAPEAVLRFEPGVADALDGIAPGDRILVLTWLHRARRDVLRVHPRDDPANPIRGVLSTRSSDRPNPIGLHEVEVLEVDGATLRVRPLEAVDGTPIVDVKPVIGAARPAPVRRIVPDLPADDPAAAARFYAEVLGLELVMDHGWIATFAAPAGDTRAHAQISLMSGDASAPVRPAASIEVADVDAAHAAALRLGCEIVHPLTDEPWGVRRFFVRDPAGNVLNVLGHPGPER